MGPHPVEQHHHPRVRPALGRAHLVDELEVAHEHLRDDRALVVAVVPRGVDDAADGGGGGAELPDVMKKIFRPDF